MEIVHNFETLTDIAKHCTVMASVAADLVYLAIILILCFVLFKQN